MKVNSATLLAKEAMPQLLEQQHVGGADAVIEDMLYSRCPPLAYGVAVVLSASQIKIDPVLKSASFTAFKRKDLAMPSTLYLPDSHRSHSLESADADGAYQVSWSLNPKNPYPSLSTVVVLVVLVLLVVVEEEDVVELVDLDDEVEVVLVLIVVVVVEDVDVDVVVVVDEVVVDELIVLDELVEEVEPVEVLVSEELVVLDEVVLDVVLELELLEVLVHSPQSL
jgi:hypothetical protein